MNRRVLTLSFVLITIFFLFRFCSSNKQEERSEVKPSPLAVAENSGPFTQSFTTLLDTYYSLANAFVASSTDSIDVACRELVRNADSLRIDEIQADSSGTIRETAKFFAATISNSGNALISEKDIESKRKELNTITDALWSLTRTVRYDGQKVYYQYCPMAFDNAGAYWLSRNTDIKNPYSSKMPQCGEVTDSLDYRKK